VFTPVRGGQVTSSHPTRRPEGAAVRVPRPAAVAVSALALAAALGGCNREAVAPEQGVDAGTPTVPAGPDTGEPGTGEGADVGVDGTTGETPGG
jgi:hypothetical protein